MTIEDQIGFRVTGDLKSFKVEFLEKIKNVDTSNEAEAVMLIESIWIAMNNQWSLGYDYAEREVE